jgi:hypothetical protein
VTRRRARGRSVGRRRRGYGVEHWLGVRRGDEEGVEVVGDEDADREDIAGAVARRRVVETGQMALQNAVSQEAVVVPHFLAVPPLLQTLQSASYFGLVAAELRFAEPVRFAQLGRSGPRLVVDLLVLQVGRLLLTDPALLVYPCCHNA